MRFSSIALNHQQLPSSSLRSLHWRHFHSLVLFSPTSHQLCISLSLVHVCVSRLSLSFLVFVLLFLCLSPEILLFVLCLGKQLLLQDKIHAMVYPMPEYFSDPHAVHVVALAPLQDQVADLENFTTTAASDDFQVFFFLMHQRFDVQGGSFLIIVAIFCSFPYKYISVSWSWVVAV